MGTENVVGPFVIAGGLFVPALLPLDIGIEGGGIDDDPAEIGGDPELVLALELLPSPVSLLFAALPLASGAPASSCLSRLRWLGGEEGVEGVVEWLLVEPPALGVEEGFEPLPSPMACLRAMSFANTVGRSE